MFRGILVGLIVMKLCLERLRWKIYEVIFRRILILVGVGREFVFFVNIVVGSYINVIV